MYLHLGKEAIIRTKDVIGIFDMDTTTVSKHSRRFLSLAEKRGEVKTVSGELPKSFIVCLEKEKRGQTVYISQLSASTLLRRSEIKLNNL